MSDGHTTLGAAPALTRSTEELDSQHAEHDRLHERDPVAFVAPGESSPVAARSQSGDQSPTELPLQTRERPDGDKPENSLFVQGNGEFPSQNKDSEDENSTDSVVMTKMSFQSIQYLPHLPVSTRRLSNDGDDPVNLVATIAGSGLVLYYKREVSELLIGATSARDPNAIFTAKQNTQTGAYQFYQSDSILGVSTASRKFKLYPYSQPNSSDSITEFLFSGDPSQPSNRVSYKYGNQMFVWVAVVNADKNTGRVEILSLAEAEKKEDGVFAVFSIRQL